MAQHTGKSSTTKDDSLSCAKKSSAALSDAGSSRRLVVKIGSTTITKPDGAVDLAYLDALAAQIAAIRTQGWHTIIVSSGAIACGLRKLKITERPNDIPSLQAAASVGQNVLVAAYDEVFARHNLTPSLVLLTRRDTADRRAYLHARDTLFRLNDLGVVPIVNENDTVAVEHIRFGENDTLGALVACLVKADLAVILSDVDGLYDADPHINPEAQLIKRVDSIDQDIIKAAGGERSSVGRGGMATKVRAARVLGVAGIPLVVCGGYMKDNLINAVKGEPEGTLFSATRSHHEITPRKLWIALGDTVRGAFIVDEGAKRALIEQGGSLLSVGIHAVEGQFDEGEIVDIKDISGYLFARGRASFSRDEIELAIGKTREELKRNKLLAVMVDRSIVHRDDLIIFE